MGKKRYDAADYLSYRLLERLLKAQHDGRDVTKTQFWKLPCIADRYLQDELDINVKLPRYWYQYGEILNASAVSDGLFMEKEDTAWEGTRIVLSPGIDDSQFEIGDRDRVGVDRAVHKVVSDFANEDSHRLKGYQYRKYSPTEFIRVFDEFRQQLKMEEPSTTLSDFGEGGEAPSELALKTLDDVYGTYPKDMYGEGYSLFLRWEDTVRMVLEGDDIETASSLTESFWETFSKIELRLKHEQNTPEAQMLRWEQEKSTVISEFRNRLSNIRGDVLAERDDNGDRVLDTISESYSDTVREML
ncbi:hypothetical protein EGH25_01555 [Haladaptatus sp. F3-133]|jgi:hypothetical protein|uniref:Uncharacterized protein n=1 Tax=Halorutilus salinus TaxID=2487751 RepID=A0A9Q4C486_9EURY|nr:hypothetical protein [Halorutilus salinus]MCX2818041.1 hypothetical protein [Halorutilus salinus]